MQVERGLVMVIHEEDLSDGDRSVIGVATTRDKALEMIREYYGFGEEYKEEAVMSDFKDIRDNNLDFSCIVTVSGYLGGVYKIWAEDFNINTF